ncbi:HAMP domain-containing histidine kinase [bacterium]|nr:HAMP domain-containing histidine kinase [candidate division CSSED10-310 bacterium]
MYQYKSQYENLALSIETFALLLGHDAGTEPQIGNFSEDNRLEINMCNSDNGAYSRPLKPHWPDFCLAPTMDYIDIVEKEFRSKTIMVFGESGFLILILFISSFMLYRLVWLDKRSDQELHELWSRVTHEIKTPIAGVKAFLQTLKTHQKFTPDEIEYFVDLALKQIARQEQLADNILVGRRLEDDGSGLFLEKISLDNYLRDYFKSKSLLVSSDQVIYEFPKSPVLVSADPNALRVIFDNIVDNATKYGGDRVKLKVRVSLEKSFVQITVTDDGPGFHPKYKNAIFEAFRRLDEELPVKTHGSGMGLYLSRQLALKMKGDMSAFSEGKDKGASVMLLLKRIKSNGTSK